MRYVPGLIPERSKVLPDYFKGSIYRPARKTPLRDAITWILGICFFLFACTELLHPALVLLHALTGFLLFPPGHRLTEQMLQFRFTTKIKMITILALFAGSMPLALHYGQRDEQKAKQEKLIAEQTAREQAAAAQKAKQQKDSLNYYLQQTGLLVKAHKTGEADKLLQQARRFSATPGDAALIAQQQSGIAAVKTSDLIKAGKYKEALPTLEQLLAADPDNNGLRYKRAICYCKTGHIQEAVADLKPLIQAGNDAAEQLHDKINPIRKRIIGYETLCCDGSTSDARGQGACSHHGGVCDWNHPITEEYRKYE